MTSCGLGTCETYLLPDSPFAKSIGLSVELSKMQFVWIPGQLPYHVTDAKKLNFSCPLQFRAYAHRVDDYVPISREGKLHAFANQKA